MNNRIHILYKLIFSMFQCPEYDTKLPNRQIMRKIKHILKSNYLKK